MPLYEYQCQSCSTRVEVIQRMSEPPLETCDRCGGDLKKLISAPAFQFKGSGWYVTDYKGGGTQDKGKDSAAEASKSDGASKSESEGSSGSGASAQPSKAADGGSKAERMSADKLPAKS